MCIICLRRREPMINSRWKDVQIPLLQKDTDPSLIFVANLNFSPLKLERSIHLHNLLLREHNGFLRQCGGVPRRTSSMCRHMSLHVFSWIKCTNSNQKPKLESKFLLHPGSCIPSPPRAH